MKMLIILCKWKIIFLGFGSANSNNIVEIIRLINYYYDTFDGSKHN